MKVGGATFIFLGLFTLALAVFGLRRGQRVAWLTMWVWPPYAGIFTAALLLLTNRKDNPSR